MSVNKYDKESKKLIPIAKNQIQTSSKAIDDAVERATQDKQEQIQFPTLPTASADNLGKVYQYIGETNTTYTSGVFYKCVFDGTAYEWKETSAGEIEKITAAQAADMWDGTYTHTADAFMDDVTANGVIAEVKSRLDDKADKSTTASGYGITDVYTKTETESKIANAITRVYKPSGSVSFENLPTLDETVLGNVYNVTNNFTTDVRFIEGSGQFCNEGTNVVVIEVKHGDAKTYWFDLLSATIDLSNYSTTQEIEEMLINQKSSIDVLDSEPDNPKVGYMWMVKE